MKKGIGTERKEAAITNQTGGGAGAERSSEATLFFFFKLLYVSFDVLFPDSPDDLFFCEKLNGGKKINPINQQSWNQKVSWMPPAARLT